MSNLSLPPSSPMKTSLALVPMLVSAVLLLSLPACTPSTRIATHAAGHAITIDIEGHHSLETGTNRAVIVGEFGKITVEPARVQLGDGPWTKIPEDVPMIVGIVKHKRWVTAGGLRIKETSR